MRPNPQDVMALFQCRHETGRPRDRPTADGYGDGETKASDAPISLHRDAAFASM